MYPLCSSCSSDIWALFLAFMYNDTMQYIGVSSKTRAHSYKILNDRSRDFQESLS
jgi:hypothetical protein